MPPTRASLAAPGAGALPSTTFSTSSVQHGGAELPLCPKIGAAQQRRPTVISFNGLTRLNFSRTSVSGMISFSVTTGMRASAGTRFNAMLQPTHPALRAVDESGVRLMMGSTRASRVVRDASSRTFGGKIFDAGRVRSPV